MGILREIFADSTGSLSSTRIMGFMVLTNIMLVWTWKSYTAESWVSMDWSTWAIITTMISGKVIQKRYEHDKTQGEK